MNYSIIIPHKNSTKLLQRCLDSIPFRDDLEVIIVDDNSDPEVVDFDNFPGKERPNTIIIFSKEGGRQGRVRNIALPHVGMDTEHVRQEIAKREARKAQSLAPTHTVTSLSTFRKAYCDSLVGPMALNDTINTQ